MVKVIPLGGLGEVGLNMMVIEHGSHLLVVDAGLMFPDLFMPGVDLVIPDFQYLRENREKLQAVILTHGHEDHIGALPFLLKEFPVPVYGTRFTLALVQEKLKEHVLPVECPMHAVGPGSKTPLGPFRVEYIRVNHSVVDGVGLAIHTPEGTLLHSGDFRIDPTPVASEPTDLTRFAHFGEKGVLAFFSDSTNAEKEGFTLSEKEVKKTLKELFQNAGGRVIVASFASNISRIQQVISLAEEFGRKVLLSGKSMITNVGIARDLGFIQMSEGVEILEKEVARLPENRVAILTTGSQGEPMSALSRMSQKRHKGLAIKAGDTVILSSKFIPGNETAIAGIINRICRLGAQVIYEKVSDIHTSGHARREELKLMLSLTRPRFFIPIHGEYRHLIQHAQIAREMGIPQARVQVAQNGDVLCFEKGGMRIEGPVAVGRVLVDGKGVGDVGEDVLRDRRRLSGHGMAVVLLAVDENTGETVYGPEILSRGFVFEEENPLILKEAECIVLEILDDLERPFPIDRVQVEALVQKRLKRFFYDVLDRSPVIIPVIIPV